MIDTLIARLVCLLTHRHVRRDSPDGPEWYCPQCRRVVYAARRPRLA